ncbi:ribonuclease H-like domain-containing protein [Tanacetum coccineum]|uniref:Ribonuclease H-like domain-containing protein n=1 Tax=Tanacetum coccineum TaxID=301880 RepID=A0ABQ5BCF4_9ASTR
MSMDDLYNNLKVYEPEVKGMSSSSSSTQNMAFVSSSNNNTSSSNEAVNAAHRVITAYSTNIDNLSDADLQQIHPDDIEEIDLRWQMAMLTMRARRFLKNTGRKLTVNGNKTIGFDKSKVSALQLHQERTFCLKECKLQEIKTTRTRKAQEGAEEGPNYALMAYSSSSSDSEDYRKTGLESVEEKLKFYKKNESVYVENINGLKWDIQVGEITIRELRKKLEKIQKEKDSIQFNVDKFENASKSLNKLIECQIVDNCKKGLGYEKYNGSTSYTIKFMPLPDLSFTGLDEFVNKPVVENRKSDEEVSKVVKKNDDAPIIEEWVSDSEEENVSQTKTKKKTVKPSRKTIKQVKKHSQNTHSPRGNQRNWNNMMSQKLGSNFEMFNKACYVCGSFDHLQVDCNYHQKQFQNQRMVKPVWNNAQRAQLVGGLETKHKVLDHVSKHNSASITLKKFDYIDAQGRSKYMTGNMSYLTDYKEIDGGYVAFGGNPKGGKITRKCTIKTGNLDFENMYFVRELKFTLFSVSQMCDKKNSVLFNDTECIILSPNFKLIDESQVLLRVPRKNNMYSVDLKNIVPKGGLTYLFAKATSDESKLWHRRLGHLNFKTMNKLFKGNLVSGLPSKLFENDQTCVACQKGKQHSASSTKDETSGILKSFITGIENIVDDKVKVIRCDNGTEFKNREMNQFCEMKGKFDGKTDEGFFVRYSLNSKAFRVFNSRTRIVEENLYIRFSKSIPNAVGSGPDWLFDIDALTKTMNYEPIVAGTQSNGFAGQISTTSDNAWLLSQKGDNEPAKDYILLTIYRNKKDDSKWVFRNKKDEMGIVIRNQARLVAQRYTQEEGIDYDEVFGPVARIEAIRLFLGYASFKDFVVYQMDVKSVFLYEKIEEEVYVYQPPVFEDPNFPDRVYKVEKALYGLHQAPRDWHKGDILLIQVYVDDIIFGSTKKELCNAFEKLMHEKF